MTRDEACPKGYRINRWSAVVGNGSDLFRAAIEGFRRFQMHNVGWIQQVGPVPALQEGELVCTRGRLLGVYALNVTRIVYVDVDSPNYFCFAYGTTPQHPLAGEERFSLTFEEATGDVTFGIFAFSRPHTAIGWLLKPALVAMQRRFCRDATRALLRPRTVDA